MSQRYTSINLPTLRGGAGLALEGRRTPEEMYAAVREYYTRVRQEADEVLGANIDHFQIETYKGVYVCRDREVVQQARERD